MDNFEDRLEEQDESPAMESNEAIIYPPKYKKQNQPQNVWMKSIISLALYLALGYYIFKQWEILLLITAIVMIHELGHFFAMKFFKYGDLGIFFIPTNHYYSLIILITQTCSQPVESIIVQTPTSHISRCKYLATIFLIFPYKSSYRRKSHFFISKGCLRSKTSRK